MSFSSRARWLILLAAALGVSACLYYLSWELRATGGEVGLPLDDSWIHLRFARSLAEGRGMAYQGDGLVSGSTGPLWTALLSLAYPLGLPAIWWAKLMGVAAFLGSLPLVYRLARDTGASALAASIASGLFGITDWMVWGALSGMEIPLFVLLSLAGLSVQAREAGHEWRSAWALPLLALAALARPEGMLLLGLAFAERLVASEAPPGEPVRVAWRWPRSLWPALLATVLIVGPFALFSWAVSGSAAPSTLAAKTAGFAKLVPALRDFWRGFEILFRPQPWMVFFAGAGVVRLLTRRVAERCATVLPALWLLALPAAYSLLAPAGEPMPVGNFGRYLFPLIPVVVVLGAVGLTPLLERLAPGPETPGRALRASIVAALVVTVSAPTVSAFFSGARRYGLNVGNVQASDVAAGRWIAENLPPDALIGVQDIGAIAYLTPNPLIDMVGIVDPPVAVAIRQAGFEGLRDLLLARGVEYLVLFPSSYGGLRALARALPPFDVTHRFAVPQNITMAGDELVVLRLERP